MGKPLVHIEQLNLQFRTKTILNDLAWVIHAGEQWLLSGTSGSGKTLLAKVIAGLVHAHGLVELNLDPASNLAAKVMFVAQWFQFKDKQGSSNLYYQQRYNSQDSENSETVLEAITTYADKVNVSVTKAQVILQGFNLWERRDAPLLQLSSGEHKKLQLTKALMLKPQLLILDNPYTGLDVQSRGHLNERLNAACAKGMQLIMISNDGAEPECINRFAVLKEGKLVSSSERIDINPVGDKSIVSLPSFLTIPQHPDSVEMVRLEDVNVTYGDKHVLQNITWTVNKGDKWLLSGHNGSGKSTLLSLLTGDNPQAYAQEMYLFGKKRGSGESIWDIKERIGFISPELQWYFEPSSTLFQTVASGFFDTSGLFRSISTKQGEKVKELLELFQLEDEANTLLKQLPVGKQRIALLARAIIKNPTLLILDEPCQGLDDEQTTLLNNLVDQLCTGDRTLIYVGHFENRLPKCINERLSLNNGMAVSQKHNLELECTK
ncbi:MAG: molybdenum transporter ATP-binding protein [Pedobacter sp.]|jgi:molybdate transport system ATP-binding protein|nr:molybdenum transporter ATP-binding protein [Pedobacter sp.]